MEKWEELFPQNTRKKGRELLENGRIRDLSVNENEYSAAVLGRERYEVKISMDHGIPVRTECSCAVGRGRGKCAHMAAVLYAAEQEKAEERTNILNGLNFARKVIATRECDFLLLDEILGLMDKGIAPVETIIDMLKQKDESMHIIMTGRWLPDALKPYVDSITTITTELTDQERE